MRKDNLIAVLSEYNNLLIIYRKNICRFAVIRVSSTCYIYWSNLFESTIRVIYFDDYVERRRGRHGVECVAYLFAPKGFHLCRGNHEIRPLQEEFTFYTECFNENIWQHLKTKPKVRDLTYPYLA